jgi:hypothetical protein
MLQEKYFFILLKIKTMNTEKNKKKDEILVCAKKMQHYNDLLIAQCDSWLSAEEGMKQMEKCIMERTKKKKK